jgi:hypothetical protein
VTQIRKRLTYANVMSSIAVFLILGGATAFAASKIGANQLKANSVKTGKIVKEAVTAGKIKNGAITTNKLANDAVTGAKANESTFGEVPSAANANSLGGLAASGYQHALRWAVVAANATTTKVVRGNATGATRLSAGNYTVSFAADIRPCAYVATLGDVEAGVGQPGEISVEQLAANNPTTLEIRIYNSAGAEADPPGSNDGFHIAVICP